MDPLEVPRLMRMSRRRVIPVFIGALVFVCACIILLVDGGQRASDPVDQGVAWVGVVFFGWGLVLFGFELVSPSRLALDNDGFSYRPPWRVRSRTTRWADCGPFRPWGMSGRRSIFGSPESVMFHRTTTTPSVLERANDEITGGSGGDGLRAGFDGLGAVELAALMNRYRDHFGPHRGSGE